MRRRTTERQQEKNPYRVGRIVWGVMNKKAWAGMLISAEMCGLPPASGSKRWIYWFGDKRVSEIDTKNLLEFESNFHEVYRKNLKGREASILWKKGVFEALKEYGSPLTTDYTDNMLLEWARNGFIGSNQDEVISDHMKNCFKKFTEKNAPDISEKQKNFPNKETLSKIIKGKLPLNSICLACYGENPTVEHPIVDGLLCDKCKIRFESTIYVIGNDGIFVYCTICACVGKMAVCENVHCCRVFCMRCIGDLADKKGKSHVLAKEKWHCYLCRPDQELMGLIKIREQWESRLHHMFGTNEEPIVTIPDVPQIKKKLRVLSLFDGISTGYYVLTQLGFSIEKYYSSEIDNSCIKLNKTNYPDIVHLGSVLELTENKLKSIGPIDLVIGGSPCNDLSLANPNRRGLHDFDGTGVLFFEYYRVLSLLRIVNKQPYFWLYENVNSMPLRAKETISRFFECEPKLIDASFLSGQSRPRLFWGNLPSLRVKQIYQDCQVSIQESLDAGRIAMTEKIQTVTTRNNSLLQGPGQNKPVMDKRSRSFDLLNISELERCFGFKKGYTACPGFSDTVRRKLIGKCWSVPVIASLLKCLKSYYSVAEDTTSEKMSTTISCVESIDTYSVSSTPQVDISSTNSCVESNDAPSSTQLVKIEKQSPVHSSGSLSIFPNKEKNSKSIFPDIHTLLEQYNVETHNITDTSSGNLSSLEISEGEESDDIKNRKKIKLSKKIKVEKESPNNSSGK